MENTNFNNQQNFTQNNSTNQTQNNQCNSSNDFSNSQNNQNFYEKSLNLTLYDGLIAYIIICVIILLMVPVIYIRNEIYFLSRDIAELSTKKSVLTEENRDLNNKIEVMDYKHEISDPIAIINENKDVPQN